MTIVILMKYAQNTLPIFLTMMDEKAFLSVNLRDIANGRLDESVVEKLRSLQKGQFDPENIGAEAKRKLVFQKFLYEITQISEKPSEAFTRMLLKTVGIHHVRDKALPEFQELVGAAFREFVNVKILQRLELTKTAPSPAVQTEVVTSAEPTNDAHSIVTTEVEIEVFEFTKQRLAFLVKDEKLFDAISRVRFVDRKGKFVVYYDRERRGRLFDFFEGRMRGPKYRFAFADCPEEVTTDKLVGSVIDEPLLQVFARRVADDHPTAANSD